MRKFFLKIAILALFLSAALPVSAQTRKTDIYFFYGDGCPHCAEEEIFLDKLEKENKDIDIHRYEVWYDSENSSFLARLSKAYGWNVQGVPFTVIGEKTISGYLNDETTGREILRAIDDHLSVGTRDMVGDFLKGGTSEPAKDGERRKIEKISLPVFGEIDLKGISLPLLTVFIAALDGLNPCALWVLLFLVSLSIGTDNRGRLLVLGSAFVLTSAVFYFLVLAAWLNVLLFIGFVSWIRVAIGAVAIYAGYVNIKRYLDRKKSCEVIEEDRRKKIIDRVKELASDKKIWLALAGIIVLAVSVNAFELVCSAGLPAVYVQILSLSALSGWKYYAYLTLYSLVFVSYQIAILAVALAASKIKAVNPKHILFINLLGGIIMLAIGFLLLFKPSILMFG